MMMQRSRIEEAVTLLVDARRSGDLVDVLPVACQPATADDSHAIQDATVERLGDSVHGWKIASAPDGAVIRGVLLQSRVYENPARIAAAQVPLLGVEAEIAFRFERDLAPRDRAYDAAEVAAVVTALVAIEVVDSRFQHYRETPLLHRLADCMSNGAFVQGTQQTRWREFDLAKLHVTLSIDGTTITSGIGGHPTVDPLLPAIALVNHLRTRGGVRAGQVMTTGTYTGLNFAKPGQTVTATFRDFGAAQVSFT